MSISLKHYRNLLITTAVAFGACTATSVYAEYTSVKKPAGKSAPADKNKPSAQPEKKQGEVIVGFPEMMLVPVGVVPDPLMNNGCWVKLYDQKNLQGDSLTLLGPTQWAKMIGPFGNNWENKIRSLETGPKAELTIFDNRDFKEEDKFITAGTKVVDLSRQMGFFDDFRSLIVSCR